MSQHTLNIRVLDQEELKNLEGSFVVGANFPGIGHANVLVEAGDAQEITLRDFLGALTSDGQLEEGNVAAIVNGKVAPDLNQRIRPGDEVAATRQRTLG